MDLFFLFKKLVGTVFMPLPLSMLFLALGLIFLKQRRGRILMVSGFLLLLLSTTPMLPDRLLGTLEQTHRQYDLSVEVDTIVVLGCNHVNAADLPITAQLHHCSLARLNEAKRLFNANPNAQIITSGSTGAQPFSQADMNKRMLQILGIPDRQITANEMSKDTREEAQHLAPLLRGKPFALVTSASHMKRAVWLFEDQGLIPYPAPTEHLVKSSGDTSLLYYMPASKHLKKTERWWYETLGLSWLTIRQWF